MTISKDYEIITKALSFETNHSGINKDIGSYPNMSAVSSEDSIVLTKIGCDYEHQTLLLQFHTKASNRRKTKRIHIKRFIYKVASYDFLFSC